MPTSRPIVIDHICGRILELKPRSVLDIGVGFGKFGFLAREYTDVWNGDYFDWKARIDGIEIFERYVGTLQRLVYDNIYIGDAVEVIDKLGVYDLVICSDMLEHLEKDRGAELLGKIGDHSRFAIVALPVYPSDQGDVYDNEHERHRANWAFRELNEFGPVSIKETAFILEMKGKK